MLREIVEALAPYEDNGAVHNEFKTYKEILKAVKAGKPVYWANDNYEVQWWDKTKGLYVYSKHNKASIGLGDTKYDIERCYIKK